MPGFTLTGGNTNDYVLGRGIVYFSNEFPTFAGGAGFRDLGNCTNFTVTLETETKEHQSSLAGLKTTDLEVALSQKMNISFTLDELNLNNLALFFQGNGEGYSVGAPDLFEVGGITYRGLLNAAAFASTDYSDGGWAVAFGSGPVNGSGNINCLFTNTPINLWLDLKLNLAGGFGDRRAYNFEAQGSQAITVTHTPSGRTGGTAMVENTDYEIDRKMGRIRLISATGLGKTVLVAWAAPTVSMGTPLGLDTGLERVKMLTNSGIKGKLKFIQKNPTAGDHQHEYEFHQVTLKPEGDFSGIGDEFTQISFTAVAEPVSPAPYAGSPYGNVTTLLTFRTT